LTSRLTNTSYHDIFGREKTGGALNEPTRLDFENLLAFRVALTEVNLDEMHKLAAALSALVPAEQQAG